MFHKNYLHFLNSVSTLIGLFILFCLSSSSLAIADDKTSPKSIEVMILGTFHFTGGGQDVVNEDIDDFLKPERQKEIEAVLKHLESYNPDKIMLELDNEKEMEFNQEYEAYLRGNHKLTVNERQQLGMRLAARLGHKQLYAIDYSNFLDYRPGLKAARALDQQEVLAEHEAQIASARKNVASQKGKPLAERLIALNSEYTRGNNFFLTIAQMGSVENAEGALSVLTWWERNLVMFARAAQYAEPGDKILIIVGAGHKLILQQMFEGADGFELVYPVPYLKR
ncbi:hypothetical protein EYS14_16320 [Alteromonadaceae bacterium M269]|nr:hypothetical protein EYS14_16320 [Alteromonadaceae bacterium M269]